MALLLDEIFENEWYIVRYSGETPEISYNASIYYLTRAVDGPKAKLSDEQVEQLKQAAFERYREIVLRDLYHENCADSSYRGVLRSIYNYERLCKFCGRQQLSPEVIRKEAAVLLEQFLQTELQRIETDDKSTIINCTFDDLREFAGTLGVVAFVETYQHLARHCQDPD